MTTPIPVDELDWYEELSNKAGDYWGPEVVIKLVNEVRRLRGIIERAKKAPCAEDRYAEADEILEEM